MAALLVILPVLAVVLLNLAGRKIANALALPVAGILCAAEAACAALAPAEFWSQAPSFLASLDLTGLLATAFSVDSLSRVMYLSIALVGLSSAFVARYNRSNEEREFRFANLLLLILASMNGIVLVRDLFALYVFLEITAVATLVLIVVERGRTAFEGAFKYMVLGAVATSLILLGLGLLFIVVGSTSFDAVATALASTKVNPLTLVALALFLSGLAIKGGMVPFHGYLPDAYSSAPSQVSVLLAGVVTKASGVYTLIRLVSAVFGNSARIQPVLLVIAAASIVIGALTALTQKDMKRMLAYSSISQVGYIVLGLAAGNKVGLAGAVLHLFNHSIFKTCLFVNTAAVEKEAGTCDMDQLGGISAKMPVTGTTSVIAFLSTAGVPPLSGFWSKLLIIVGLWQAHDARHF